MRSRPRFNESVTKSLQILSAEGYVDDYKWFGLGGMFTPTCIVPFWAKISHITFHWFRFVKISTISFDLLIINFICCS